MVGLCKWAACLVMVLGNAEPPEPVATQEPDAAEAPAQPEAEAPERPPVSEGLLAAMEKECVVVTYDEGTTEIGRLEGIEAYTVVLGRLNGELVEVARLQIEGVRVAVTDEERGQCRAGPTAPVVRVPPGTCSSDDACREPTTCVDGRCRLQAWAVDELAAEGRARRRAGHRTLIAGASLTAAGLVLLPLGVVLDRDGYYDLSEHDCPYYPADGGDACIAAAKRKERGTALWAAGTALLIAGVPALVVGAILTGVGNAKLERAAAYRKHVRATLGPSSIGLTNRF